MIADTIKPNIANIVTDVTHDNNNANDRKKKEGDRKCSNGPGSFLCS